MRLLVLGEGGREHAIAWRLARAQMGVLERRIFVCPGNGGIQPRFGRGAAPRTGSATGAAGPFEVHAIAQPARGTEGLVNLARALDASLTVVGPEALLAAGVTDAFSAAGLRCFGPTAAAARLETSKAFAKAFMDRHGIPTARFATFSDPAAARAHLRRLDHPVVIKASGLAAGKGVLLPRTLREAEAAIERVMVERAFGQAGEEVVIEERLEGPEVSLLAFCDGDRVALLPPAQDHKRLLDDDQGPNTGGMGVFAPVPFLTSELLDSARQLVLERAVHGLALEGCPYVGVLYAGLMVTPSGPRVLEFNCRFGDPECQVLLPLLETDLLEVLEACIEGRLADVPLRFRQGAAATVVAASQGYPGPCEHGHPISGVDEAEALGEVIVFHAGTRREADGRLLTSGGRVLAVTGLGADVPRAVRRAYDGLARIHFAGMHARGDIGVGAGAARRARCE